MGPSLVLIAEDDEANRNQLHRQVEGLGCNTVVVKSPEEAIEAASKKTFGVILMNCQMAALDGVETTRKIRHAEKGRQYRSIIIGVTEKASPSDRQQNFDAGMDEILVRPFSLLDLKDVLSRWLPIKDNDQGAIQTYDSLDALKDPKQDAVRVEAFRKSLSTLMQKLFLSVHNQATEEIRTAAREMKGLCHSCGFEELGNWCTEVEKSLESNDWVEVQTAFNAMVNHYRDKGLQ